MVTPDVSPDGLAIPRTPSPSRALIRKVSTSIFRSPVEQHTVVHRAAHKNRPVILFPPSGPCVSVPPLGQAPFNPPSAAATSTAASSTNSGGIKFSRQDPISTAKTSAESKPSFSPPPGPAAHGQSFYQAGSSLDNHDLSPIHETALDQVVPTVATVERVAAAKIFLETHFNELLTGRPSPRSLRRRLLETDLYRYSKFITQEAARRCREQFFAAESAHLRETRALRAKSTRTREPTTAYDGAEPRLSTSNATIADEYEIVRNLGKGSYGVVRLVRARRHTDGDEARKSVYAMKVIRKSAMVRTSQEGHLRAERDFLVASKGSKW